MRRRDAPRTRHLCIAAHGERARRRASGECCAQRAFRRRHRKVARRHEADATRTDVVERDACVERAAPAARVERTDRAAAVLVNIEDCIERLRSTGSPERAAHRNRLRIVRRCQHCGMQGELREQRVHVRRAARRRFRSHHHRDRAMLCPHRDAPASVERHATVRASEADDVGFTPIERHDPAEILQRRSGVGRLRRAQCNPRQRLFRVSFNQQRKINWSAYRKALRLCEDRLQLREIGAATHGDPQSRTSQAEQAARDRHRCAGQGRLKSGRQQAVVVDVNWAAHAGHRLRKSGERNTAVTQKRARSKVSRALCIACCEVARVDVLQDSRMQAQRRRVHREVHRARNWKLRRDPMLIAVAVGEIDRAAPGHRIEPAGALAVIQPYIVRRATCH